MADLRPGTAGTRKPSPDTTTTAPAPDLRVPPPVEPSLGDLVASASKDLSTLVRSEIQLAKLEMKKEAIKAATGGGMLGAAAFLGLFALMMLSFAAAYGLEALGLATGWSFLIVAGAYLLLAGGLTFGGVAAMKRIGAPERTIRTTKDTVAVLKKAGRPTG